MAVNDSELIRLEKSMNYAADIASVQAGNAEDFAGLARDHANRAEALLKKNTELMDGIIEDFQNTTQALRDEMVELSITLIADMHELVKDNEHE